MKQKKKQIEGCTMRFLKEFVGTDYRHSARVNNCSWLLVQIVCIAEKLKCVRSYYLIDSSKRLSKHAYSVRRERIIFEPFVKRLFDKKRYQGNTYGKYPDAAMILHVFAREYSAKRRKRKIGAIVKSDFTTIIDT